MGIGRLPSCQGNRIGGWLLSFQQSLYFFLIFFLMFLNDILAQPSDHILPHNTYPGPSVCVMRESTVFPFFCIWLFKTAESYGGTLFFGTTAGL